jgi:hypothetical protein
MTRELARMDAILLGRGGVILASSSTSAHLRGHDIATMLMGHVNHEK